jgi:excisionase family DNA binding protein
MNDNVPKLLTVAEVAALLSCSRPTVIRMVNSGALPALRLTRSRSSRFRIPRTAVLALIDVAEDTPEAQRNE